MYLTVKLFVYPLIAYRTRVPWNTSEETDLGLFIIFTCFGISVQPMKISLPGVVHKLNILGEGIWFCSSSSHVFWKGDPHPSTLKAYRQWLILATSQQKHQYWSLANLFSAWATIPGVTTVYGTGVMYVGSGVKLPDFKSSAVLIICVPQFPHLYNGWQHKCLHYEATVRIKRVNNRILE